MRKFTGVSEIEVFRVRVSGVVQRFPEPYLSLIILQYFMDAFFRLGLSCVFTQAHIVSIDDGDDDSHSHDFMDEFLDMTSKLDRGRMLHGYHLSLCLSVCLFCLSLVPSLYFLYCLCKSSCRASASVSMFFPSALWNSVYLKASFSCRFRCSHYRRRCKIRAPCCDEVFDCRHCHNEAKVIALLL